MLVFFRPGVSSLREQCHFHFAKGTSIVKSNVIGTFLKGHQGQDQGQLRGLQVIPGLVFQSSEKGKVGIFLILGYLYIYQDVSNAGFCFYFREHGVTRIYPAASVLRSTPSRTHRRTTWTSLSLRPWTPWMSWRKTSN